MLIARLIADAAQNEISLEARVNAVSEALSEAGLPLASAQMLDHSSDVLQLELPGDDAATLRTVIDAHFGACDGLISNGPIVVPRLFVSDMDSTMIGQECIDELADYAGLKEKIAEITERAMQGELDFESALLERVGLLAGLDESAIGKCLTDRIVATPGAQVLVETLKAHRCRTVLVTGGFHHFADRVAEEIGFERVVGNRLAVADGKLTGDLAGPIVDSATKVEVLQDERDKLGADAVTMAAGDGANDIPMLDAATYGVAYRAKPKARAASNGWIDHGDLTSLLKLLEIPQRDWVYG